MLRCASTLFQARGIELAVLALYGGSDPDAVEDLARAGCEVLSLPEGGSHHPVVAMKGALMSWSPDIVHVHPERRNVVTTAITRYRIAPTVRTIHASFEFTGVLRQRKRLERSLSRGIGVRQVAVSESVRRNEKQRFANPVEVILNWFDDQRFYLPSAAERERARGRLDVPPSRPCVVILGNCGEVKRHDLALRALAACPPHRRPLMLHAGDEGKWPGERQLAADLGLGSSDVRFLGSVADVPELLHAADRFIMPSQREGFGVAAVEAAACGVPLVLTDVPGLVDLAVLGPQVTLVTPTVAAVAEQLEATKVTGGGEERLASAARNEFSVGQAVSRYSSLYLELLSQRT